MLAALVLAQVASHCHFALSVRLPPNKKLIEAALKFTLFHQILRETSAFMPGRKGAQAAGLLAFLLISLCIITV
jgi:hypothetical protein